MSTVTISRLCRGYTLVELMLVVAVIAIIAVIAVPAYNGYISESRLATARMNADSLRIFMEDYFLDNATYVASGASPATYNEAQLQTNFGWSPDGDQDAYIYSVTATTNSWHIVVEHASAPQWIRCENRMSNCCDSETSGASKSACP
jgi:prepilin-type N-terminal cleavage/methylation domain-containing protein